MENDDMNRKWVDFMLPKDLLDVLEQKAEQAHLTIDEYVEGMLLRHVQGAGA